MSRRIIIDKYEGNTHYNIHVIDGFGQEHHLGYYERLNYIEMGLIERQAEEIWENEVKYEPSSMSKAIAECIQSDIDRGVEPNLD